jgi:hypothetical protein
MATTLINVQEVINGGIVRPAPLNARFDAQLLAPQILAAELRFVKPILCADLYAAMIADKVDYSGTPNYQIATNYTVGDFVLFNGVPYECIQTTTGTQDPLNAAFWVLAPKFTDVNYQALWANYLREISARAVFLQSIPNIAIQTGSNGLYSNNSEYSQNAGTTGAKWLQDNEQRTIEVLQAAMQDYLCQNRTNYPLYPSSEKCRCETGCSCSTCNGTSPYRRKTFGFIL